VFCEHQRALLLEGLFSISPRRSGWDKARIRVRCQCCDRDIGAGEAFRLMTAANLKYCANCAKPITGEDPPSDLDDECGT
jgi:hypothetical protein